MGKQGENMAIDHGYESNRDGVGGSLETESFLGDLWGRISGGRRIVDRTHLTPVTLRKGGLRPAGSVYALVLHQMAFSRGNDPARYNTVNSHFAILPDGAILQLHPVSALLWASNGFNARSVAVEFAGNFPNIKGKCWSSAEFGCHRLTNEQVHAGRHLVDHLIREIGLTHVLAHRQSSASRENDPGPDIWYHVGQWAISTRGLRDGGATFKVGSGNPIPTEWRVWGQKSKPGYRSLDFETEVDETELEASFGLTELGEQSEAMYGAHTLGELEAGSRSEGRWVRYGQSIVLLDA